MMHAKWLISAVGALAGVLVFAASASAVPPKEVPVTRAPSEVTSTSATLNGELNPEATKAGELYEYIFSYQESASGCAPESFEHFAPEPPGKSFGEPHEAVSVKLTQLEPGRTYTYCLVAVTESGEEAAGPEVSFSTLGAAPSIGRESASGITSTDATLSAEINPENQETSYYFEYSDKAPVTPSGPLTDATVITGGSIPEGQNNAVTVGPVDLAGALRPDTTYYYRVAATNTTGGTLGIAQSFTTQGAPLLSAGVVANITDTTATFAGTVNPDGAQTTYRFEYISEGGYLAALTGGASNPYTAGAATASFSITPSHEFRTVGTVLVAGLLPGTTYHYALVAYSTAGSVIGPDGVFTTAPPIFPVVATGGASLIGENAAEIQGTVGTNGLQTSYGFEIGTEAGNYSPATGLGSIGGATTETVSMTLDELQPGTTYYYRITATNADGSRQGEPQAFTTYRSPTLISPPASPPLIAGPNIAFPTEEKQRPMTKTLTRAEKLAKELKTCKKYKKGIRVTCERRARSKFGAARAKEKGKGRK
jgi:hypothetical protein